MKLYKNIHLVRRNNKWRLEWGTRRESARFRKGWLMYAVFLLVLLMLIYLGGK